VSRLDKRLFLIATLVSAMTAEVSVAQNATILSSDSTAGSGLICDQSACDASSCDSLFCGSGNACCDGASCGCLGGLFSRHGSLGLIKPSERCFDDFVSPMINFVFFEDPRTVSELRPIFVHHNVPDLIGPGIPAGGSIQLYAMQFRVALTERLSVIGVKDGYIVDNTNGALDTLLDDGWADITAGLKYNLLRNTETGTLASVGFTYEIPLGSTQALQSVGDGEFHCFLTGGQRLLDGDAHLLSSLGYRFAANNELTGDAIHWSNHFDYRLTNRAYIFTEAAWWHWTDEASVGLPLGVAGQDLFSLPSTNIVGNDLVTQSVGLKFKPRWNVELGTAYEFPLTEFKDVIEDRWMADLIIRY
jgi:hypothetical protein